MNWQWITLEKIPAAAISSAGYNISSTQQFSVKSITIQWYITVINTLPWPLECILSPVWDWHSFCLQPCMHMVLPWSRDWRSSELLPVVWNLQLQPVLTHQNTTITPISYLQATCSNSSLFSPIFTQFHRAFSAKINLS